MGGWNNAKKSAGLSVSGSNGSRIAPQPSDVNIPSELAWEDLSANQRRRYKNADWNKRRSMIRRRTLRDWLNTVNGEAGCESCGMSNPACLNFHHMRNSKKSLGNSRAVTQGYGKTRLRSEKK